MRAVTGNHIIFNECIEAFRPEKLPIKIEEKQLVGYLLLDFRLNQELDFEHFTIKPSIEVYHKGAYSSFVAPVVLKRTHEFYSPHLFITALSAITSFIFGRPVKAPRDGYLIGEKELDENSLYEIAIQYPILTAGPGCHSTRIHKDELSELYNELKKVIAFLYDAPFEVYKKFMRSIRLVHLAFLNQREDFALGYYLLVSAIEPFLEKAIKDKEVISKHPLVEEWKSIAETNESVKELFEEYRRASSMNKYIRKRFVEFIMKYCPPSQWDKLKHPFEEISLQGAELTGEKNDWITKKQWNEIYPEDLTEEEIRDILSDAYKHRSQFTHQGKNPPHKNPNSFNRFFEKEIIIKEDIPFDRYELILPNFRLMGFIVKNSILNYLYKQSN
ncbi:hypothetical protein RT27_20350 [Bacillus sp. L_1B0_5]|uniref:hypothetical protein n=1 Tax=Bacillus sp. L_1B0_5 TaxID=1586646 RepID=UPI0005B6C147|nr:hypothetical protein [Bacillus sp. L_1B0_5]KIQ85204.1 hypothetical protein RT27_20350 [Bacillus sp. L_1B0_5]